ncbi:YwqH-like family protein [Bacillus nakamurai]|uniref:YwqH-like family protein n=1 Tax=Bacillus nakamurai TaxID=1793963 RepID=UPI0020C3E838|nr:DUF5082 family protein [Bacillus nakamurai]MCP6680723.1 DUF5082 domain-containing protein [Bacillus nakamurai]
MHAEMSALHSARADFAIKQEQIHELKRAKHEITDLKHEFSDIIHMISQPHLSPHTWKGSHAKAFEEVRDDMVHASADIKKDQVNGVIERINEKISILEDDVHTLQHRIRSIESEIRKQKEKK